MEAPYPLTVEDLIGYTLNNRRKLAKLITQYRNIFFNILQGTALFLQGVTEGRPLRAFQKIRNIFLYCVISLANHSFRLLNQSVGGIFHPLGEENTPK